MEDAIVKLIAWLMAMAALGVLGTLGVHGIELVNPAVADHVNSILMPFFFLAGLVGVLNSLRIAVLWRSPLWTADRRKGLRGIAQNPGDLDVVVGGLVVLAFAFLLSE